MLGSHWVAKVLGQSGVVGARGLNFSLLEFLIQTGDFCLALNQRGL